MISHRPVIYSITVRPRAGPVTLTLTFKVKVIPRPNAQNESKVFGNMSDVLLDHTRWCQISLVHLGYLAQNSLKTSPNIHFSFDFDQI
jgi:hypothetical protein